MTHIKDGGAGFPAGCAGAMDTEAQRQKFEAWASGEGFSVSRYENAPYCPDSHLHYVLDNTRAAYLGWQAALKHPAMPELEGDLVERVAKAIDPVAFQNIKYIPDPNVFPSVGDWRRISSARYAVKRVKKATKQAKAVLEALGDVGEQEFLTALSKCQHHPHGTVFPSAAFRALQEGGYRVLRDHAGNGEGV